MTEWQHKVGGPDKIVKLDEAIFGKRKYNKGSRRKGVWVFGCYERGSNPPTFFMIPVKNRNEGTLSK